MPTKEYFENAAKQIPWPVEVGVKKDDYKGVIHVPHFDMERASNNLMVSHLVHHGFVIQQTIDMVSETKVFDPEIRLKSRPEKTVEDEWPIGCMFKIKSTSTRLEITSRWKDSVDMKYPDGEKMPFKATVQQIERSLSLGVWIRL
jgi:hypothetical protein